MIQHYSTTLNGVFIIEIFNKETNYWEVRDIHKFEHLKLKVGMRLETKVFMSGFVLEVYLIKVDKQLIPAFCDQFNRYRLSPFW